jgi:hypothetical protein
VLIVKQPTQIMGRLLDNQHGISLWIWVLTAFVGKPPLSPF